MGFHCKMATEWRVVLALNNGTVKRKYNVVIVKIFYFCCHNVIFKMHQCVLGDFPVRNHSMVALLHFQNL